MREALALKDHRSESQIYVERAATGAGVVLVLLACSSFEWGTFKAFNTQTLWRARKKTGCRLSLDPLFAV